MKSLEGGEMTRNHSVDCFMCGLIVGVGNLVHSRGTKYIYAKWCMMAHLRSWFGFRVTRHPDLHPPLRLLFMRMTGFLAWSVATVYPLLQTKETTFIQSEVDQAFSVVPIDVAGNIDYKSLCYIITHGDEKEES